MEYISRLSTVVQWNFSIPGTIGTPEIVLHMEVSLIHRLSNTVMYHMYCRMRTSFLNTEKFFIQRVLNREVLLYTLFFIQRYHTLMK